MFKLIALNFTVMLNGNGSILGGWGNIIETSVIGISDKKDAIKHI